MGKGKKVLGTIAALGIAAAALFAGVTYFGGNTPTPPGPGGDPSGGPGTNPPTSEVLSVVENISYDENRLYFVWDDVENADSYVALINGTEYEVDDSECYYVPSTETTEIKVKALDSTGNYYASDWSEPYTYSLENSNENGGNGGEVTEDQVSYVKVNAMVQGFYSSAELKEILNIYIEDGQMYTNAVYNYDGTDYICKYISNVGKDVNTLQEALEVIGEVRTNRLDKLTIASEDSVKVFIDSGHYVGKLQEYKDQGYSIEIVTGEASADEENFEENPYVRMFGIYRLTKGSEVIYVSSYVKATITDVSPYISINLISRIDDPNARILSEQHFQVLEGDFATFAEQMYNVKNPSATTMSTSTRDSAKKANNTVANKREANTHPITYAYASNSTFSTDDGMEF